MAPEIGTIIKYGMLAVGAGFGLYILYDVIVAKRGAETGGSISGFLTNVGEGTKNVGVGVGAGFEGLTGGFARGLRNITSLITDLCAWVGTAFVPPPPAAPSQYHQALQKTTFTFRTVQYLREGRPLR